MQMMTHLGDFMVCLQLRAVDGPGDGDGGDGAGEDEAADGLWADHGSGDAGGLVGLGLDDR